MAIYVEADGDQTIMDYILACEEVPLMGCRNKDETPIVGEFEMTISNQCPAEHVQTGTIIEVATNDATYCEFLGEIKSVQPDISNRTNIVMVRSVLGELKNKNCTWDNLHSALSGGNSQQYWTDDYSNYSGTPLIPSAQVLWIVQTMFDQTLTGGATFAFDSGFKDTILAYIYDGSNRQMEIEHLRMDEYMLCALGADYAGAGQGGTLSYWDFIKTFCSHVFAKLEFSTSTAKQIVMKRIAKGAVNIDEDDIFDYKQEIILGSNEGYQYDHKFADDGISPVTSPAAGDTNRKLYQGAPTSNLASHKTVAGNGTNVIEIPNNWQYYWEKHWTTTDTYVSNSDNYPDRFFNPANFTYAHRLKITNDSNDITWQTAPAFQTEARSNYVLMKEHRMKILSEAV